MGVAAAAAALLALLSREVFLFWDDFFFLGQAREADLSWGYLTDPLFRHFSPVVRLVNLAVVGSIPNHPWVVPAVLFALLAGVASSVTWLMVALHGRTVLALASSVVLAPSLTLLPLGNWWTAGINIMPALVGFYVAFGAMVQLWRGRSRWWALPCLGGAALGVLDYELPMLLFGYLGLWVILCGSRVTAEPWRVALRRTWWVWLGVTAIGVAGGLNYRLNYYDPAPRTSALDLVHATGRSLVHTLIPTALGFHDPRSDIFSALSLVIGCVGLVLVLWLGVTRRGGWRGLAFAGVGWLLPTLALVVNRVAFFGVSVVDNAIYFHLPTTLFVVGVLEAARAPRRVPGPTRRWVSGRVAIPTLVVALVAGYAWSAEPTARYQLPQGASPAFVDRARASVHELREQGGSFSVLNSDVPGNVVPGGFEPYNRADHVLGVVAPPLTFDEPGLPLYRLTETGDLRPVEIDWLTDATAATPDALRLLDATPDEDGPDDQLCFVATADSSVLWPLTTVLTGPDLVVRTVATVEPRTELFVNVRAEPEDEFDRANKDRHRLSGPSDGVLDTVAAPSLAALRIKGFTPGAHVCLESVSVGRVTTTTP